MGQETELPNTEEDSTKTVPESMPEKKESNLDELAERVRTSPDPEEDIGEWLAANWQRLAIGLALVLLVVFLVGKWRETQATKLGEAAQGFGRIQEAFANAEANQDQAPDMKIPDSEEGTQDPKKEDNSAQKNKARLEENVSLLKSSYSDTTYGQLAPLYQAAEKMRAKEYAKAKEILVETGALRAVAGGAGKREVTKTVLASELASLLYARLLIDEGKTEKAQIRKHLETLIGSAAFVNLEALILLLRLDDDPKAQEEAIEIARKLKASRPDLNETLQVELGNLGVRLD